MSVLLCSSSDIITLDQNWDHLHPSSVGGKDLSIDTQTSVTGSMGSEICTKIILNLNEKLSAKFQVTKLRYSMAKISHLDTFLDIFELETVEGQSLTAKKKITKKEKGKNVKNVKCRKT